MAEDFGGAVGAFLEFLVAPILVLLGGERLMIFKPKKRSLRLLRCTFFAQLFQPPL